MKPHLFLFFIAFCYFSFAICGKHDDWPEDCVVIDNELQIRHQEDGLVEFSSSEKEEIIKFVAFNKSVLELRQKIVNRDGWISNAVKFLKIVYVIDENDLGYQPTDPIKKEILIEETIWKPIKCEILDKIRQRCDLSSVDEIIQLTATIVKPSREDYNVIYNPVVVNGTVLKETEETLAVALLQIENILFSAYRVKPKMTRREMLFQGGKGQLNFQFSFSLRAAENG